MVYSVGTCAHPHAKKGVVGFALMYKDLVSCSNKDNASIVCWCQKFATKVCAKLWGWSYHELLAKLHLPTLTQRRLHIDLCLMYKIIHRLMYFPPDIAPL